MHAGLQRRGRLQRHIGNEAARPRFGEGQQVVLALALARRPYRGIFVRHLGNEGVALRLRDKRRRHAHRAARVQHVNHRALVSRRDPQRSVHLRCRRAADQQRHRHARALHLLTHRHHLVQRRGDQAAEADHVSVVLVRGFQDPGPRHHHAKVDHLEAVALQNDADDVLADIVNVALHGRHDDAALGLCAR